MCDAAKKNCGVKGKDYLGLCNRCGDENKCCGKAKITKIPKGKHPAQRSELWLSIVHGWLAQAKKIKRARSRRKAHFPYFYFYFLEAEIAMTEFAYHLRLKSPADKEIKTTRVLVTDVSGEFTLS